MNSFKKNIQCSDSEHYAQNGETALNGKRQGWGMGNSYSEKKVSKYFVQITLKTQGNQD